MPDNFPLPMQAEDVTAEWLSRALQLRYPHVEVLTVAVRQTLGGSAIKLQLDLTYNEAGRLAGLPPVVYVKAGFDPQLRALVGRGYVIEALFYDVVAPQLGVELPQVYFAGYDETTRQAVLIMEDLLARGKTFGNPLIAYTPQQVASGLDILARLHAKWWHSELPTQRGWVTNNANVRLLMSHLLSPEYWEKHIALPRANSVQGELRNRDVIVRGFEKLWAFDDVAPPCLLHGDAHIGNTYHDANGVYFLDWQVMMRGPWAHDVSTFMVSSLSPADRRTHERELMEHYLGRLRDAGVNPPAFANAWTDYIQHILHGFLWVMNPEEMQPSHYTQAITERFAAAAEELDMLKRLG